MPCESVKLSDSDLESIRLCVGYLEDADSLYRRAAGALCPVPGFGDQHSALTEVSDVIRKHQQRIESRRNELGE